MPIRGKAGDGHYQDMKRAQLFTLAGLLLTSGLASATTIEYEGMDASRSASVWMSFTYMPGDTMLNGRTATSTTKKNEEVTVGVMSVSFDGGLTLQDAFCVDRFAYISEGSYQVNLTSPSTVANGDRAAWLLHDILPQINAATGATQDNLAAALQIAIWDIVHDGGDGFTAGRIQQSSSYRNPTHSIILNLANTMVSSSQGQSYVKAVVLTNVNGANLTQRLMVDRPGDAVPEPSTWALALTGLVWAVLRRAKRG